MSLKENLVIKAFLPLSAPPPYREVARHAQDLLRELSSFSGVSLQVIDSAKESSDVEQREVIQEAQAVGVKLSRLSSVYGGRQVLLEVPYGISLAYLNRREVTAPVELLAEVEFQLARAITTVVEGRPKTRIGVAQGFGEPDLINSPLARHLGSEGELIPVRLDGEPLEDQISALVVLGATQSYGERARWLIHRLRCDGGGVVIALDHRVQSELFSEVWAPRPTGLEPLLRQYGIEVDHQWVIGDLSNPTPAPLKRDARGHVIAATHALYPLGRGKKDHPITAPIAQVPIPMSPLFTPPRSAHLIVQSEASAEAFRGLRGLDVTQGSERKSSEEGFPLAFALEQHLSECEESLSELAAQDLASSQPIQRTGLAPSRMVVIGSGRRLLSADPRGLELLMNSIAWVRGEERLLSLKDRRPVPKSLNLSLDEQRLIQWTSPILPALVAFFIAFILRVPRAKEEKGHP